ncbi:MAG: hypothetical protein A2138_26460 [Deltaproteobacteria bacterium RBG_16_71_12]|nr:MAG: hypothetical protein A2138_26460 [Deltaproteobacteria bacterium RBG_16_71_12]
MLATALFALVAAQTSPTVGLAVQPAVGLSPEESGALVSRVQDELLKLGLSVVEAAAVDAACTPDPGCVEGARTAASTPHDALLVVELVRIGPVVQVTATGAAGEQRASGSASLDEAQLATGPVLPAEIAAWATGLAPAPVFVPPSPPTTAPTTFELTPMKSGALFAGGVGVIALGAGVILVATSEPVLVDPTSLGAAKEQARTLGLVGLGSSVLGVAGVGSAVGLWLLE